MLENDKYILLTTFRRDGTPVSSPVWIVPFGDGAYAFTTSSGSGKVKRLRNNASVTAQPSDVKGRVKEGAPSYSGSARIGSVDEHAHDYFEVFERNTGFMVKVTRLLGTIGGVLKRKRIPYGDLGVILSFDS